MNNSNDRKGGTFLLRIWSTETYGHNTWCGSLTSVGNGEKKGFSDLDGLRQILQSVSEEMGAKELVQSRN